MTPFLHVLAPTRLGRLNLTADLVLLAGTVFLSATFNGSSLSTRWQEIAAATFVVWGAWVLGARALRHYDVWATDRAALDEAAITAVLVGTAMPLYWVVYAGLGEDTVLAPTSFVAAFALTALVGARLLLFRPLAKQPSLSEDVLIVGVGSLARQTAEDLRRRGDRNVLGVLCFDDERPARPMWAQLLGGTAQLEEVLKTTPVTEVYLASNSPHHHAQMQRAIHICECLGVPFAVPAYAFRLGRARPLLGSASSDGYLHCIAVDDKPVQRAVKRLFDIVASGAALVALLPVLLTVAALIKLTSQGPVLFKQRRVGLRGKPFHILKFRSMVVNAEEMIAKLAKANEQSGPVFKMRHDPRVTRVGRFIRKYSIDELPQLLNVLRGDMSVVGPRPPIPAEVAKYEAWQRRRLSVRPGLTCIWQVSGRNQVAFDDWMRMDMQYIDHWSFWGDLGLIVKTVPVVLTGRGAS